MLKVRLQLVSVVPRLQLRFVDLRKNFVNTVNVTVRRQQKPQVQQPGFRMEDLQPASEREIVRMRTSKLFECTAFHS
jgi:hypothetical protein